MGVERNGKINVEIILSYWNKENRESKKNLWIFKKEVRTAAHLPPGRGKTTITEQLLSAGGEFVRLVP